MRWRTRSPESLGAKLRSGEGPPRSAGRTSCGTEQAGSAWGQEAGEGEAKAGKAGECCGLSLGGSGPTLN